MKREWRENWIAWVMILPAMLLFFLFMIFPIFKAFHYSLYDYEGIGPLKPFVGLDNYLKGLTDPKFYNAMKNNAVLAVSDILITITVGFFLAYFLARKAFGWRFFNIALFIPFIVSVVVVAIIWKAVYEPTNGLLNNFLHLLGLDSWRKIWLGLPDTALYAVIATWAWKGVPFAMMILFGSILRIPADLFEAAKIDGAREWHLIRLIVFPLTMPTILLLIVLTISNDFRVFDLIWVMTQGGPLSSTEIATSYVYKQGFELNHYGYANALSFIVMLVLFCTVGIMSRLLQRKAG